MEKDFTTDLTVTEEVLPEQSQTATPKAKTASKTSKSGTTKRSSSGTRQKKPSASATERQVQKKIESNAEMETSVTENSSVQQIEDERQLQQSKEDLSNEAVEQPAEPIDERVNLENEKEQPLKDKEENPEQKGFIEPSSNDKKTAKRQKILKISITVIFVAFVVGVLIYTCLNDFVFTDGKEMASFGDIAKIWGQNWWYLICALFSLFLLYFFKAAKLSVMCKSITGRWHFRTCFNTANIGIYMNNVTPLAVGGQPFEIMHLSKHGIHGGVASSLPIATFFLNQLAFVVCAAVALILYTTNALGYPAELMMQPAMMATTTLLAIIGIICCFAVPSVVLMFCIFPSWSASIVHGAMKIGAKLRLVKDPKVKTYKTIKTISHNSRCMKKMITNPWVASSTSLMSICEQLSNSSIAYFTLKFFGFSVGGFGVATNGFVEWAMIICLSLILYAAISFVPTPGNSGASELSFYLMFQMALPTAGMPFPAMMVWRILCFYLIVVIGFFSNMYMKRKDKRLLAQTDAIIIANDSGQKKRKT